MDNHVSGVQRQLVEAEARIKRAEAKLKEIAARRAEDERVHAQRMRRLQYQKALSQR